MIYKPLLNYFIFITATHFTWCVSNHSALILLHIQVFLFVACSHAVSSLYNIDLFLSTYL